MKPKILCIVGKSGSGKTTMASYIEDKYDIPMIESHTDRLPRHEGEKGHTFHTKESFDKFHMDDMIAFTQFGGNRYCCTHDDVKDVNTYVIDETGLKYLKETYADMYDITSVFITRSEEKRKVYISEERIKRDEDKFFLSPRYYDYLILNNMDMEKMFKQIDKLMERWLL